MGMSRVAFLSGVRWTLVTIPNMQKSNIGKPCLRELSEGALSPWVRPRGCRQGVLQHKRPACQQLDTHAEEAEFQEVHRHFHPMLPHMP